MEFFEFFYKLKNVYGAELYEHLKGWDDSLMDYNPDYNQFPSICVSTFAICIGVFVLFYYLLNSPRFNRWWSWLIMLIIVGVSAFGWGYQVVNTDIVSQSIAPSLIAKIGSLNATMFGLYNMVLAAIIFFVLTLALRHWSKNCKHSPWTSLFTRINRKQI